MRILIVHENHEILRIIKELVDLANNNPNIELADNIQKTESCIRNHKPDIIICNTLISSICCLSLIKPTKEIVPEVRFIVFGGLSTSPCRKECLEGEPDIFLDCPNEFDKISETFKLMKNLIHSAESTSFGKEGPGCQVPRYLLTSLDSRHKNKFLV